ncbi:MAG TPA: glycosyltransferase [Anaerolineae bacterium]|nr:glycosyltransferase [Anaerolineae bacterium]
MKVLYHLTVPPSSMAAADAVVQEVEALRAMTGGQIIHLYPGQRPGTRLPRRWWGLQHLLALRRAERQIDLHHIFNPDPFPFDVLRFLRQPIVYTVVAGTQGADRKIVQNLARRVHTLVVSTEAERAVLSAWGIATAVTIGPGIDGTRFARVPPPTGERLTLLAGSAPWTVDQFESKGIEALLETAQARPDLHLIFLWRGVHFEEMRRRVARRGLSDRVTIINQYVNVADVLAQVHAASVLARDATLVKAYPHSLLEALAAGRPILISRAIPMASYVEQTGCGKVIEVVAAESVFTALAELEQNYAAYRTAALQVGQRDFSRQRLLEAYQRLYTSIVTG